MAVDEELSALLHSIIIDRCLAVWNLVRPQGTHKVQPRYRLRFIHSGVLEFRWFPGLFLLARPLHFPFFRCACVDVSTGGGELGAVIAVTHEAA